MKDKQLALLNANKEKLEEGDIEIQADTIVSTKQLFTTIDAMPMRKEEMKHKH